MKGKSKLEEKTKIMRIKPAQDNYGENFFPICCYKGHPGIVNNYQVCERRGCRLLFKFYF